MIILELVISFFVKDGIEHRAKNSVRVYVYVE
jgi:hypothetical protein